MKLIFLIPFLASASVLAEPKQIVCSFIADEEKVAQLSEYLDEGQLKVGDTWRKDTYIFDTNDFDKDIKVGTYITWFILSGSKTREMQYTISPDWLGFNSDAEYPSDHRISRKSLRLQYQLNDPNAVPCVLESVDTSNNLI